MPIAAPPRAVSKPARRTRRAAALTALAAAVALAGCSGSGGAARSSGSSAAAATGAGGSSGSASSAGQQVTWTTFQHNAARTGAVNNATVHPSKQAWAADLGGAVRGQVVAADGSVFAATETNRVVALDPRSGKVAWSKVVGNPVHGISDLAGCGNIDPLGITSTPVIDPVKHVIYVVAEISDGGSTVHHQLFGLSTSTGAVVLDKKVDPPLPPAERPIHLLQRAALALGNGRVYVSYGGNDGDCGTYHGWVVGADVQGSGANVSFQATPTSEGGAIWEAGGGPAIAADGAVFVSTGNSNPFPGGATDPGTYAESVVKLSPDLRVLATFKDPVASHDADLATSNPVLLPGGLVFSVGKTDRAYLLRAGDLSLQATIPGVCGSDPDGGPAYDAAHSVIYVPCRRGGIQPIDLRAHKVLDKLARPNSTPIIVGDRVFAAVYRLGDHSTPGTVFSYDLASRARVRSMPMPAPAAVFVAPSTAYGLLLVPTTHGVVGYR